jgi:hypothetical protein
MTKDKPADFHERILTGDWKGEQSTMAGILLPAVENDC